MTKILMLGWELPPHNSGGLGVACINMARALSRQGIEIDFARTAVSCLQDAGADIQPENLEA